MNCCNKLSQVHTDWICTQLALNIHSQQKIADLFNDIYDIKITQQTVSYYANNDRYKDIIYQHRLNLTQDLRKNCAIANPIVQITCLEKIVNECLYPEDENGNPVPSKANYREAREAIKLATQLAGNYTVREEHSVQITQSEILRGLEGIDKLMDQ